MAQGKTSKSRKRPEQTIAQRRRTMKNKLRALDRAAKNCTSDEHKAHLVRCKKKWIDGSASR